jgi:hypothetical protein
MLDLDASAREKEIQNLPDHVVRALNGDEGKKGGRAALFQRVKTCTRQMLERDVVHSEYYETVRPFVNVPDEYSFWMRAAGLYPLAWLPINGVTHNVRKKFKAWYAKDFDDLPVHGALKAFVPDERAMLGPSEIGEILVTCRDNPFGIPWPNTVQEKRLAVSFAPVFVQDVAGPYDYIGSITWDNDRLEVVQEKPTVYYYLSRAFLKGKSILQINYTIWFEARASENAPWMERGHLDGLTVRISLDTEGSPFMVDVMNNCGCYHFFSPDKRRVERTVFKPLALDPFVPQWLPTISSGQRLGIRINSGRHQVERLIATTLPLEGIAYDLVPYHVLEALPHRDGSTESMFDAKGIAKGSDRVEPYILFSSGIPSVGAMRQRGNHPIALTGRVHFDDPHLFDRNFVFK